MMTETTINGKPFKHLYAAHCESGVTASFFRHEGVDISEPLVFGIGSGIFFGHLPFIKWVGMPLSTYRAQPGAIFRKAAKRLGGEFVSKRFRNPQEGMDELRRVLRTGQIVAIRTNVYWLPYFPRRFRNNFNGHNLIVLYEVENGFRLSDPNWDHLIDISAEDLERARFARGPLEPRGFMYYPKTIRPNPDLRTACIKGMKDTCNMMLKIPLPLFGIRGMRYLAKKIKNSPGKVGFNEACRQLAHLVRMQEEIGTGGGGFRFMYAAFLQEASDLFGGSDDLARLSREMTSIGDLWRDFAVIAVHIIKQRGQSEDNFDKASELLLTCASREEEFFKDLREVVGKLKA